MQHAKPLSESELEARVTAKIARIEARTTGLHLAGSTVDPRKGSPDDREARMLEFLASRTQYTPGYGGAPIRKVTADALVAARRRVDAEQTEFVASHSDTTLPDGRTVQEAAGGLARPKGMAYNVQGVGSQSSAERLLEKTKERATPAGVSREWRQRQEGLARSLVNVGESDLGDRVRGLGAAEFRLLFVYGGLESLVNEVISDKYNVGDSGVEEQGAYDSLDQVIRWGEKRSQA